MRPIDQTTKRTDVSIDTSYRPDIDGLRCIAVMLVLIYHLFPKAVRGGFIGVDIFFVISGYLITSILYSSLQLGNYSILTFYQRRIRRIFPALVTVLAVTFAIGCVVLSPEELVSLGQTTFGGATFSANLVLLKQIGYFDIAAENKPLLHLWSLGVEEQFYIGWPLILAAAYRSRLNLTTLVSIIFVASFILNVAIVYKHPDWAFYFPLSRAWELAAGAGIVFVGQLLQKPALIAAHDRIDRALSAMVWDPARRSDLPGVASDIRASLGVILILVAAFSLTSRLPFPGYAALLPVIGAVLLISAPGSLFNRRVLASRPFVFIGLISYPLYLWHYPLVAYARLTSDDVLRPPMLLAIGAASIVLAWLTYRFVESPIRFQPFGRKRIVALAGSMALIAVAGGVAVWGDGFESRLPEKVRAYVAANRGDETSAHWRRGSCLLLPDQDASQFGAECTADRRRPLVLLWGDSYAAALYPGMKALQREAEFGLAELTASACPPALGFVQPLRPFCTGANEEVVRKIDDLKPDIVLLHSTWMVDLTSVEPMLQRTVSRIREAGVQRIIIVGLVPSWRGRSLPQNLVDYYLKDPTHPLLPERTTFRLFPSQDQNEKLKSIAARLKVEFISPLDIMCNQSGCLTRVGDAPGDLTAFDTGHLTVPGSTYLARAMKSQIFKNGIRAPEKPAQ
ncbi:putative Acyltransferase, group 3; O-antigen acetylase [Bradyrhizobium sp. ORS 375]|uniref:acyltransferase family protein n=1 Tax=Bradyrhizobium sp. (strain ORS 375) TaxID=566679 RepID=UPI00024085A5|nr:acyltransferase family protein [Bradyrhizobium sp. ORS 375]CCD92687.1 putative Acyltransferase, group 3; O-antigen acetylase [Bradyrhizobium sp. ORS 375]